MKASRERLSPYVETNWSSEDATGRFSNPDPGPGVGIKLNGSLLEPIAKRILPP